MSDWLNLNDVVINDNSPLPEGRYHVVTDSIRDTDTKSGTGKFYAVTFKVLAGKYLKRLIFENINYKNPNQTAVDIGLATLKKIALSVGLTKESMATFKPEMILNKELVITVAIDNKDQFRPRNKIVKYEKFSKSDEMAKVHKGEIKTESDIIPW